MTTALKKGILFTDGGARGNPGPAGIGMVLRVADSVVAAEALPTPTAAKGLYIGEGTNNQAEYQALLHGLDMAREQGVGELMVCMDSELVVKQIKGQYKVKEPSLRVLWAEAQTKIKSFAQVEFVHVRREKNKEADKLVNDALDAQARR